MRAIRFRVTTILVALILAAPSAPAVAQTVGHMSPAIGTHPLAVHVTPGINFQFECQHDQIDVTNDIACRGPDQVQAAYGITALLNRGIDGTGRTIVIVDAFQNPTITTDLASFDALFGLPDPTFTQIAPDGLTPFNPNDPNQVGWSAEIALDVQWAHAVAPGAAITLVLAKTNDDADILSATKYAVDHNLGDVISQSFGEGEACMAPSIQAAQHKVFQAASKKNITLFASSGDSGAGQPDCNNDGGLFKSASTPASDPNVTGVGGTNLRLNPATGAYRSERSWSDQFSGCFPTSAFGCSGGGFSILYSRPDYQRGVTGGGQRGVPDVAYNGGVDGGVIVWFTVGGGCCFVFGGTSAGSPQWAGLVALADQLGHHRVGNINEVLYGVAQSSGEYTKAFHDVTTGNNNLDGVVGFHARTGWDAVTGLGSPQANVIVRLLAGNQGGQH